MMSLWLFTFLKVCTEENKNSKHHFLKHEKDLILNSSLYSRAKKKLEMFIISCTNIWPNFILILPRILKKLQNYRRFQIYSNAHYYVRDSKARGFSKNTKEFWGQNIIFFFQWKNSCMAHSTCKFHVFWRFSWNFVILLVLGCLATRKATLRFTFCW